MKLLRCRNENFYADCTPRRREGLAKSASLAPDQLKQAYALARAAFTADDLQKFTEVDEEGVPMEAFLAELEKAQAEHDGNARRRNSASGNTCLRLVADRLEHGEAVPEMAI